LSQFNTDRQFNYSKFLDEINSQTAERNETMDKALTAAGYGDYSFLQNMGIDTSKNPTDWERQYTLALLAAEYGDYSGLRKLGINLGTATPNSSSTTVAGKTGSGGVYTGGYDNSGQLTDADIASLETYYGGKELTQEQWDEILSLNDGVSADHLTAAGFSVKKASGSGSGGPNIDMRSIAELGYGPITDSDLDRLVASGQVEEYEENGYLKFRRANNGNNGRVLNRLPIPISSGNIK